MFFCGIEFEGTFRTMMRVVILWIILCFTELTGSTENMGAPVLQPFSLDRAVVLGESVALPCVVSSGRGPFSFRWSPAPPDTPKSEPLYSLLLLRDVDASKAGNYTCFVTNPQGTANQTVQIVVHEPPEWTFIPDDAEVTSGGDLRVDCSAKGLPTPTVTWTKGQGSLNFGGRYRHLLNGSLLITDVEPDDAGEFECSADNGVGLPLRKTVQLTVHVPPQFQEFPVLVRVRSGHSAVLRCDVSGDTPLRVTWSRDHMDERDERYSVHETPLPNGLLSELTLSRTVRTDAGLYICSATNAYGHKQKMLKLVVQEPPSSPPAPVVKGVERNEATVRWSAPHSGNSPITKYLLQYWRDTGGPPKLEEIGLSGERTQQLLTGLRSGSPYVVRVIAENEFGPSTPSVPVRFNTLEDKPSGYPTDLTIASTGLDHLKIQWKAPAPDERNGILLGYELGFREVGVGGTPYSWRSVPLSSGALQEMLLEGLRPDSEYEVVVRARNGAGKGPPSLPIVARTRQAGELSAPTLWVESASASSLFLKWSGNDDAEEQIGHVIYYRASSGPWMQLRTAQGVWTTELTALQEGTLYQLYAQAVSGHDHGPPSETVSVRTQDPSFARSSMEGPLPAPGLSHSTLVISLSVVCSCVVIVCVIAAACVYVTRVTATSHTIKAHNVAELCELPSTSRSSPLSRYVRHSRPLLYCSTPAPPPDDYPSPYATLPLRHGSKWNSEDPLSSDRSESLANMRVDVSEDKISNHKAMVFHNEMPMPQPNTRN